MLAAVITSLASVAAAQDANGVIEKHVEALDDYAEDETVGFRQGSVVVAPIPFSNPTIGSGLVLGAGYLFQLDEGSDPSVIGAGGLRSDNGSTAAAGAFKLKLDNNRWIIEALYGQADVQYDLFTGIGVIPIRQDGILGRLSLSYGVTPDFSFGATFRYLDTTITPAFAGLPPIPPPFDQFLNVEVANVGVVSDWDTRDDTIYPTSGQVLHFEAFQGYGLSGLVRDYSKSYVNYTFYLSPWAEGVIASRLSVCAASSETPFFDQCGIGTVDSFRGFSATQLLDFRSASLQVELRQRLGERIGLIAFAGAGQTGQSFSDLEAGGTHSAYGVGARYRVSKKFPLDFSIDLSRNDQQEDNLYIYVGQRF
ncbi:BamA/TamA family outer membrane protein [Ruegeria marisrubri]|uniref:BamA/TamA family outer membrane protein n=1 Tax=Ruegeria marisrubri TaxID=1685379 RepID=UPI001F0AEFB7|nr:BamA/TamA family outer membrane protein [Ruegeria marisrubri]